MTQNSAVPQSSQTVSRKRGQLYGRAKGKRLSQIQQDLLATTRASYTLDCRLLTTDPAQLLDNKKQVFVEIGFGSAEHLYHLAKHNPDALILGAEPFYNGLAKALELLVPDNMTNVKFHHGDGRDILQALPDCSLNRVYVLYPDPWPKRRQRKRRFLSTETFDLLARKLKPCGMLYFATDIDDYAGWVLARVLAHPHFDWPVQSAQDWTQPWPDYPSIPATRYEAKALREGRISSYFRFIRR